MKKGLILVNAYSDLKHGMNQSIRLKEEFENLGVSIDIKRNDGFLCSIDDDGKVVTKADCYDFCVYLDKDKYTSHMLEKSGLRLFNSADAIEICDDKMVTYEALSEHAISMPYTLPGLLCYDKEKMVKEETLDYIEKTLGYPLIAKESYGSLGKEVYKIDNRKELVSIAEELKCKPHLFQRFISSSHGKDIRVIVVGGKYYASMLRKSENDFRSNIELGGKGYHFDASDDLIRLCEKVSNIIGLDYCGIDVLFGPEGYLICEVNSNAFFGGIEQVTGLNVAKKYAEYICSVVYK